jgi:hypothetical protein
LKDEIESQEKFLLRGRDNTSNAFAEGGISMMNVATRAA